MYNKTALLQNLKKISIIFKKLKTSAHPFNYIIFDQNIVLEKKITYDCSFKEKIMKKSKNQEWNIKIAQDYLIEFLNFKTQGENKNLNRMNGFISLCDFINEKNFSIQKPKKQDFLGS